MTFEEYIEELCRQHPHILHEVDDKCHFSCLADDAQTKLARNMHYPCVVVDTGDFAFNGSVGNVLMNTEYSIMFLTHVRDIGNSVEVLVSFAKMKRLSLDFLRKISRDKKKDLLEWYEGENTSDVYDSDGEMGRLDLIGMFLKALNGECVALPDAEQALTLMKIIDAIYASAQAKTPINVSELFNS